MKSHGVCRVARRREEVWLNPVLQGLSLSVDRGETLALVGENGAEKSTLMRIVGGYVPPTAGTGLIDERSPFPRPFKAPRMPASSSSTRNSASRGPDRGREYFHRPRTASPSSHRLSCGSARNVAPRIKCGRCRRFGLMTNMSNGGCTASQIGRIVRGPYKKAPLQLGPATLGQRPQKVRLLLYPVLKNSEDFRSQIFPLLPVFFG
ncbi:ATP-binding cassette domain-containing protein [Mesorhizobium sp. B2-3-3]|nr:ATP-binding cassette domain-containing protein [Mesorhizobium sp. B2-3-3]